MKKVASDCYKAEREPAFNNSGPAKLMNQLLDNNGSPDYTVDTLDWEDVFLLSDDNHHQWPSKTSGFK